MKTVNSPWLLAMIASSLVLSGCNDLEFDMGDEPEEVTEEPAPEPTPEPEPEPAPTAPDAVEASFVPERVKTFSFAWNDVAGATSYRLLENPDGISGFTQVGSDIDPGVEFASLSVGDVPLYERIDAEYMIESCNDVGCTASDIIYVNDMIGGAVGYVKSVNTNQQYSFGGRVALSGNGNTLVVSQMTDDSASAGVDADFTDVSGNRTGSIQIFERIDGVWQFSSYITPEFPDPADLFGQAVEVSHDGLEVFVGVQGDDSGIDGDPSDNSASSSGAVYVYEKSGSGWAFSQFLKAGVIKSNARFASSLDVSADNNYLFVGTPSDNSRSTGINGNEGDTSGSRNGSVSVFKKDINGDWIREAYLKTSSAFDEAQFGAYLDSSADGATLAVSAHYEDSLDTTQMRKGALYVFNRSGSTWSETVRLSPPNGEAFDFFGIALQMSADGSTIAASSQDDSGSAGINGDESDNSLPGAGATYIFEDGDSGWAKTAYIKSDFPFQNGLFGGSFMHLNSTGDRLYVAEDKNGSDGSTFTVDNFSREKVLSGAVYIFEKSAGTWIQERMIKAFNAEAGDRFGNAGGISADETTKVFSAEYENSNGTLFNGDPSDNNKLEGGAVYIY